MARQEEVPIKKKNEAFAQVDLTQYENEKALQTRYREAVREAIKEADRKMNEAKTA